MEKTVTKSEWHYRVYAVGYAWMDGKPHYTGIAYTERKDAVKALDYYGKGYVEASRCVETKIPYEGTSFRREYKTVCELN